VNKSRQQGCFHAPCRFFTLFSLFVTFVPHITQKAKPSFPPLRWPALVVRAYALFNSGSFKVLYINKVFLSPSVEQLRMKAGKTMVALNAMAGHSRFLQKRKG
jgi:hypothetical protein